MIELCGQQIKFHFAEQQVDQILREVSRYQEQEIECVRTILYQQMRKYQYLF